MKDKILEIAKHQLQLGGYDNLNFNNIATELSTTRANLHHHFKNKEGLALKATQEYIKESNFIFSELAEKNKGDFAGYLKDLDKIIFQNVVCKGIEGSCICEQLTRDPNTPEHLLKMAQARFRDIRDGMEKVIRDSQEQGRLKKDISPKVLSILTMNMLLGISQMSIIYDKDKSFTKTMKGSLVRFIEPYRNSATANAQSSTERSPIK